MDVSIRLDGLSPNQQLLILENVNAVLNVTYARLQNIYNDLDLAQSNHPDRKESDKFKQIRTWCENSLNLIVQINNFKETLQEAYGTK